MSPLDRQRVLADVPVARAALELLVALISKPPVEESPAEMSAHRAVPAASEPVAGAGAAGFSVRPPWDAPAAERAARPE